MPPRLTRGRGRGRAAGTLGRISGDPDAPAPEDASMDVDETQGSGGEDSATRSTLARSGSIGRVGGASGSRGVGGLLGESSEYARRSTPGAATTSKLKFVPNMRRKIRPKIEDEDE